MKAQILYGIGNLNVADIEVPTPKNGEALIKVSRCGICGSDVPRIFKTGAHNMPIVPGHEFSGVVEECSCRPELVGKRVGVFPLIPCMECVQCKSSHYEMCENYNYLGSRCDGGFAEYVCVPVWNLIPLPDEVSDDEAAMLEPMAVAVHALLRSGETIAKALDKAKVGLLPGEENIEYITVCGLGTIGLMVAMFLRDAGFTKVLLIGNKTVQKEKVLEMGYSEESFCDVRYRDPFDFIMEKTDGKGTDYYFECIGRPENYAQAVKCTAPLGNVMLVGNPYADMELPKDVYWKILRFQLTLRGTWNSSYEGDNMTGGLQASDDWRYVIGRIAAWKKGDCRLGRKIADKAGKEQFAGFGPEMLITHRYSLEDMQEGLRIMQKKSEEYIKIMVEI